MTAPVPYRSRFPIGIIQHAVWLYHHFPFSDRDVQELLQERGMEVGHDTLRAWPINFSPCIAEERCHWDEVCTTVGALPIIALFYGFQRYFVGGTVAGGVKE